MRQQSSCTCQKVERTELSYGGGQRGCCFLYTHQMVRGISDDLCGDGFTAWMSTCINPSWISRERLVAGSRLTRRVGSAMIRIATHEASSWSKEPLID